MVTPETQGSLVLSLDPAYSASSLEPDDQSSEHSVASRNMPGSTYLLVLGEELLLSALQLLFNHLQLV